MPKIRHIGICTDAVHGTADYFAYSDAGTTKKITPANINLSSFNNDSTLSETSLFLPFVT